MQFNCPACGKTNNSGMNQACQRCNCDLTRLQAVLAGASWHLRKAAERIRSGAWQEALAHAERSWNLKHSAAAARIAFLAAAAIGSPHEATHWNDAAWKNVSR